VSVLFNMTKIWDEYVGKWLRTTGIVAGQHPIALTDTGKPRIARADYVVHQDGKPVAVYDAKYRPWQEGPKTDEIYQLYTYARRLGVTRAALVYPAPEPRRAQTSVAEVTIETLGLPVRELGGEGFHR
jgi:5-methylcytosine-specific restriction endonuclease McrBC regulatory subunit McrC